MRRGPGLAALDRTAYSQAQFTSLSDELTKTQLEDLRSQLDTFSRALRNFANVHRQDIRRDPEFRMAFQRMCSSIGVDPLGSSSSKGLGGGKLAGIWNDLLGFGDWQYELGVQIIDVCVSTRNLNGGLIEVKDLIRGVMRLRTGEEEPVVPSSTFQDPLQLPSSSSSSKPKKEKVLEGIVTEEDILRSLKALKPLGCGYEVVTIGDKRMVRSVPTELGTDAAAVLAILSLPMTNPTNSHLSGSNSDPPTSTQTSTCKCDSMGFPYVTHLDLLPSRPDLKASGLGTDGKPSWTSERARAVLDDMLLRDEMLWVDEGAHPNRYYSLSIVESIQPI
ncbi:winged helix DNA-binding domain-containing protein [Violaceomyces palustris]|uniref:Winged helix DNA-binding domain-containing protein n=1 Tax=Violaceomyces palustris TaxID=1673888 RepID=A0ACD0NTZ5_9BASI|nr:winged helix DNA-binding domain-containing protein [Violaceomyces palustris]